MKKLVIFDMSGILFDTETVLLESNQKAFSEEGLLFRQEDYVRFAGTSQKRNRLLTQEMVGDEELGNRIYERAYEIRLHIYDEKGAPTLPGLEKLLEELASRDIKMLVASSNDLNMVQLLLNRAQISDYFMGIVAGDQLDFAKPHPDIFLKALEIGEESQEDAVAIEDSLNGVEAANRADLDVIMVPNLIQPQPEDERKCLAVVDRIDRSLPYILGLSS